MIINNQHNFFNSGIVPAFINPPKKEIDLRKVLLCFLAFVAIALIFISTSHARDGTVIKQHEDVATIDKDTLTFETMDPGWLDLRKPAESELICLNKYNCKCGRQHTELIANNKPEPRQRLPTEWIEF